MTHLPPMVDIAMNTIKRNSEIIIELRNQKYVHKRITYDNDKNLHNQRDNVKRTKSAFINQKIKELIELNDTLREYVSMRLNTKHWNLHESN